MANILQMSSQMHIVSHRNLQLQMFFPCAFFPGLNALMLLITAIVEYTGEMHKFLSIQQTMQQQKTNFIENHVHMFKMSTTPEWGC